jgi:hypothetical protein
MDHIVQGYNCMIQAVCDLAARLGQLAGRIHQQAGRISSLDGAVM